MNGRALRLRVIRAQIANPLEQVGEPVGLSHDLVTMSGPAADAAISWATDTRRFFPAWSWTVSEAGGGRAAAQLERSQVRAARPGRPPVLRRTRRGPRSAGCSRRPGSRRSELLSVPISSSAPLRESLEAAISSSERSGASKRRPRVRALPHPARRRRRRPRARPGERGSAGAGAVSGGEGGA